MKENCQRPTRTLIRPWMYVLFDIWKKIRHQQQQQRRLQWQQHQQLTFRISPWLWATDGSGTFSVLEPFIERPENAKTAGFVLWPLKVNIFSFYNFSFEQILKLINFQAFLIIIDLGFGELGCIAMLQRTNLIVELNWTANICSYNREDLCSIFINWCYCKLV